MNDTPDQSATPEADKAADTPKLELSASRGFQTWLAGAGAGLAFTTYQAGKLFLLGVQPSGRLSVFERCLGLHEDRDTLWMSCIFQMWRFENALEAGQMQDSYDAVYLPQVAYTTGDLDIHDVMVGKDGKPIFCATLFNCLGTISETCSFQPIWRPPFISKLAAEGRCHLNGLARKDGQPAYVTIVSRSDSVDG